MNTRYLFSYLLHVRRAVMFLAGIVTLMALLAVAAGAAPATPPTATNRLSQAGGLSSDDLKPAVTLLTRASEALREAADQLQSNRPDQARAEVDRAETLLGAVQRLLADSGTTVRPQAGGLRQPRFGRPKTPGLPAPPSGEEDEDLRDPFDGPHDPFAMLNNLQRQMDRMMGRSLALGQDSGMGGLAFRPDTDIEDDGTNYTVKFDVPGAEKSKIDVHVEGRVLTVSGTTERIREEKNRDHVIRSERRSGQFQRVVTLPGPVQADKVEARCEKGVLSVIIPKATDPQPQKSVPVI